MIHLALHLRLRGARGNEFAGPLSWSAIAGAALFGALHLVAA